MQSKIIQNLISHFSSLPGIGPKTAERLVFYLLKQPKDELTNFGHSILKARDELSVCKNCGQISENSLCNICADKNRDQLIICVVAEMQDILPLEKSQSFNGVYHVLNGYLNPLDGITADKLNIKSLEEKIKKSSPKIKEIILALNPTIEGESTSLYLINLFKNYNIPITKLARGLPQGADLEYADEITLSNALKGRQRV